MYTKKWVRTITDTEVSLHPELNSAASERSDYPDNRSEGRANSEQALPIKINGSINA